MLLRQLQSLSRKTLRPEGLASPAIQACHVQQPYRSFASRRGQNKADRNETTLGELGSLALTKLKYESATLLLHTLKHRPDPASAWSAPLCAVCRQLPRAIRNAFSRIFSGTSKLQTPQDPWAGQASGTVMWTITFKHSHSRQARVPYRSCHTYRQCTTHRKVHHAVYTAQVYLAGA